MAFITSLYTQYRDIMDNHSDPRVKDFPLMSSPFPTILISLSYVYFVKVLGPKIMENRKPFELRKVLIIYNFIQVVFSVWLFYESIACGWFTGYSFRCQAIDTSNNPLALRMVDGCWYYFFSKFTEFLDTIFFVMRKRNNQVTTLHVIHHSIMPVSVWWGVKFLPGGHSTFFGFVNVFVHAVMYTYYMLAAMGPEVQKYLWWKKYLTQLQLAQFTIVMIHAFQLLFKNDCGVPISFAFLIGGNAVMFFFLFINFYQASYSKKAKKLKIENENKKNESIDNAKETCPIYEKVEGKVEDSYSTTRHRVFVGSSAIN